MRSLATFLGGIALALAAIVGCQTAQSTSKPSGNPSTDTSATDPTTSQIQPDLPCDIAAIVTSTCGSCHGTQLAEDAKIHLLSRADFVRKLAADPTLTVADQCVQRMQDQAKPMPPNAPAPDDAIAAFQDWIANGMPEGTCAISEIDWTSDSVCTSNKKWTLGDRGSELMHPGQACNECHDRKNRGPSDYSVAGTLYPSAHEPDNCNGTSGAKVVITDANGVSVTLTPNAAGNFVSSKSLKKPLHAKVVKGDLVYEMGGAITEGDCNTCHTETGRADEGADYPRGRIVTP